ncbi:MAG: hypothetical protein GXP49_06435 [Deltaproteobacteria bacterium]|nr:hypothetical protein [Deltaproteobacteria bacterium]
MGCITTALAALLIAGQVTVNMDCPKHLTVGDWCKLDVSALLENGRRLVPLEDQDLGPFRIFGCKTNKPDPRGRAHLTCTLAPFETGNLKAEGLLIKTADAGGAKVKPLLIPAFEIHVESVLEKGMDTPRPIKGLERLEETRLWPGILLGLCVLALLVAATYYAGKRFSAGSRGAYGEDRAFTRLNELLNPGMSRVSQKKLFNEIAWLVRDFLDRRLPGTRQPTGRGALQSTRREIKDLLQRRGLDQSTVTNLADLLFTCDRVRFAGIIMEEHSTREWIQKAIDLLHGLEKIVQDHGDAASFGHKRTAA